MAKITKQNRIKEIGTKIAEYLYDYMEDISDEEMVMITEAIIVTEKLLKEAEMPNKESLH